MSRFYTKWQKSNFLKNFGLDKQTPNHYFKSFDTGTGDWNTWMSLFNRYLAETNAQEKKKLMYGLGKNIHAITFIILHYHSVKYLGANFASFEITS